MQPKGIRNSPEVAPGSQNPSPMDVASVLSKMPSPCVNARGLGQSRGRGRGRDSQVTASSQAIREFSYILQKGSLDINHMM